MNGKVQSFAGYQTDILASFVVDFINSTPSDQPFFVLYTPSSPHLPADDHRYSNLAISPVRTPNWNVQSSNAPVYMQGSPLTQAELDKRDNNHKVMSWATRSLDDSVKTILDSLGARATSTLVVYLSDNGYLYGEHRRWAKQVPYEESVHVPMVVRYPRLRSESDPISSSALVENVDIAATIADLTAISWTTDGISLVPLLTGEASSVRTGLLIEHCVGAHLNRTPPSNKCDADFKNGVQSPVTGFYGIVTARYKYLEYLDGEKELYDLTADPYELTNHAGEPAWAQTQSDLASQLAKLKAG